MATILSDSDKATFDALLKKTSGSDGDATSGSSSDSVITEDKPANGTGNSASSFSTSELKSRVLQEEETAPKKPEQKFDGPDQAEKIIRELGLNAGSVEAENIKLSGVSAADDASLRQSASKIIGLDASVLAMALEAARSAQPSNMQNVVHSTGHQFGSQNLEHKAPELERQR